MVYNQEIAEVVVVGGIIVVAIGVYWRVLAIGVAGIFSLFVLMNHSSANNTTTTVAPEQSVVAHSNQQVVTVPQTTITPVVEDKPSEFAAECMKYGIPKKDCNAIWNDEPVDKKE